MKLYLLPIILLFSLAATAQISHRVDLLDVQSDGDDKDILELAAFGGNLYWAVDGDVNYLSTGTVKSTTSFPGGLGFRDGIIHLGDIGKLHYFYFSHDGQGYYAEADPREPMPRLLKFPLTAKEGYTFSNPVMIGEKFYVLREDKDEAGGTHAQLILELDPADESGVSVHGDTVMTTANPLAGRVDALDGKLFYSRLQSGSYGAATYDVSTGTVANLGTVETSTQLDFRAAGNQMLLSYTTPDDRQVSRFFDSSGGGAEHAVPLQVATAVELNSGLLARGNDGTVYRVDYADGAATPLVTGDGTHDPLHYRVSATEAIFLRPDGAGSWILGRTDGSTAGTADVLPLPQTGEAGPTEFARFGRYVGLTSAYQPLYLFGLDTDALQEVAADCSTSAASPGLATIGDRIYFAAEDPAKGKEIHFLTIDGQSLATGTVFRDDNGNGVQDSGEAGLANVAIDITGGEDKRVYTDTTGTFRFVAESGTGYTVTTDPADCYSRTSATETYSFTYSAASPPDLDFGFQAVGDAASVRVHLSSGRVRCNTESPYWMTVQNDGCLALTGTATVTLPDSVLFVSANPDTVAREGQTFTFDLGTLEPGQSYFTYLKVKMPSEAFAGADIDITAAVNTSTTGGDAAVATTTLSETLRCAVDPNDKQVSPRRPEPSNSNYTQLDETLTYKIRFQNTGNDTAYDVRIEDDLSAHLDLNTFKLLGYSHRPTTRIREGGRLEFRFDNIYLPDSNANPAASQGFVSFEIRSHADLADFTEIENTAAIYFDFNKPVITNTVISTMVEELDADADGYNFYEDCDDHNFAINPDAEEIADSGADENCDGLQASVLVSSTHNPLAGQLTVYPNPAGRWLRIEHDHRGALDAELIDATGRRLETVRFTTGVTLPTEGYATGVYVLRVTDVATGAASHRRVVLGGHQ